MVDSVGLAGGSQIQGLSPGRSAPGEDLGSAQAAGSFKDVLLNNLKEVNALQRDATEAIEDLQTGQRNDLETVLMATAKADTAFRMLLAVRNKMMDAYNELQSIRV